MKNLWYFKYIYYEPLGSLLLSLFLLASLFQHKHSQISLFSIVRQKLMSSSMMLIYLAKYQPEVNQYHYKQKKALLLPTAYQKTEIVHTSHSVISSIKKLLFKSGRNTKERACWKKTKQQQKKKICIPAKKVDIAGCFSMSDIM